MKLKEIGEIEITNKDVLSALIGVAIGFLVIYFTRFAVHKLRMKFDKSYKLGNDIDKLR